VIYSASRRTDLPAFFPDYICQKVQRSRKLEAIVFWTKDPRNLVEHPGLAAVVSSYPTIIQLTITGLGGSIWEQGVPEVGTIIPAITELARVLPAGAIRWRFDPIIAEGTHFQRFSEIFEMLTAAGVMLESVVVSFPDPYSHAVGRIKQAGLSLPQLSFEDKKKILQELHAISGIPLALCCEQELLTVSGIIRSRCIDGGLFDRLYGTSLGSLPEDHSQRQECGCCRSTDIGSYQQECRHKCLYCYANRPGLGNLPGSGNRSC